MSLFPRVVDERFLSHRRRSTSIAGQAGGLAAIALFGWRYYMDRQWNGDLLAVCLILVGVKLAAMAWYLLHD